MSYRHRKSRLILAAIVFPVILLAFASCATAPPKMATEEWFALLPEKSSMYIYLDKAKSSDLLDEILVSAKLLDNDVKYILSKTDKIYGTMDISGNSQPVLSIVTLGSYPASLINLRLSFSKYWEKKKYKKVYFVNKGNKLEVAFPGNSVILISQKAIEVMLENYIEPPFFKMPDPVKNDLKSSDLLIYFPAVPEGTALKDRLTKIRTAVNEIWIAGNRKGDDYELSGAFIVSTDKQAKVFAALFRLIITAWLREEKVKDIGKVLKSITVAVEGSTVRVSGFEIPEKDIVPLLMQFMKKDKEN